MLVLASNTAPLASAQKKTKEVLGINFHSFFTVFQLFKIIYKYKPKKVISYAGAENFQTLILKMFFWNVSFYRFKGNKLSQPNFLNNLKLKLSHVHVKCFVTPSDYVKEHLMQQTNKKIHVVLMAINSDKFRFLGLKTKNEMLIVGRLDPVKGFQKALDDFAQIKKKIPNITLRIIGEPKNISKQTLESWVQNSNLALEKDVFVDYNRVDNIENYINHALIGWVCSEGSEYICRVAYEFLMCGTPMMVSRVNSLQSIFDHKDGLVYSLQSHSRVEHMTKYINEQLKLSDSNRQDRASKFQKRYGYDTHVGELQKI